MAAKEYQIVLTMNAKQIENYLKVVKDRAKEVKKEMAGMQITDSASEKRFRELNKELKALEDTAKKGALALKDYHDVLKDLSGSKLYELRYALRQVRSEMEKMSAKDPRLSQLQRDYKAIEDQIAKINGGFKKQGNVISQVAKRLSAYVLIYTGFNIVKNKIGEVTMANIRLSDALADVRKTTGLANEEVTALAENLLKMDTRTTMDALNQLAYQGGRMGVGKYGQEAVEGFVRAAEKMNVALGEDLGEDSVEQIYKLADVMGIIPKLGVEGALLSVGSAINELVQTGTSSGTFIVDFSSRMAGIAAQANLTAAEVAGLGSALDEMGQEVEVSATSMNKFVMQMFTHYTLVAKAAGMSAEGLKSMLESGKTADAIVAVMEGLNQRGGLSQLAPLFKDLGSDGARLSQTLSAMASNVDKVKNSLNTAREAFGEARSVTDEYNIKNETTAAILERVKNAWTEMFVNPKNKGIIHEFVLDLKEMSDELLKNEVVINSITGAIGALVLAVKALIALAPGLILFAGLRTGVELLRYSWLALAGAGRGIAAIFNMVGVSLGRMVGVNVAATASTLKFVAAWKALTFAMKANIIVGVISLIYSLITAFRKTDDAIKEVTDDFALINKGFKKFQADLMRERDAMKGLFEVARNANSTVNERAAAIKEINKQYGEYLPALLTEKSSLDDLATAQQILNTKMEQGMALRAKQNAMLEVLDPIYKDMAESMEVYNTARKNDQTLETNVKNYDSRISGYSGSVFRAAADDLAAQGMTADAIFNQVLKAAQEASQFQGIKSTLEASMNYAKKAMMPYIENAVRKYSAQHKIDETYDPIIGDYLKNTLGKTVIEDQGDEGKGDKKKLAKAKKDSEALVSKIKEYYTLQQAKVNELFSKGLISDEVYEGYTRGLDTKLHESLMHARRALINETNNWDDVKNEMGTIGFDESQDALKLLHEIQNTDIHKIVEILSRLGKAESDAIGKKAAEDYEKITKAEVEMRKEVTKLLLQDDYRGTVMADFKAQFEKMKLMTIDYVKFREEHMDMGEQSISYTFYEIWANAFKRIRASYEQLYDMDINTSEGQEAFRQFLEPLSEDFPALVDLSEEKLRLLYAKMMQLHDADDAARKKAEDHERKIMKHNFSQTSYAKENKFAQDKQKSDSDWTKIMGGVGLSTEGIEADQEMNLYKLRLEAAAAYYEYVMTHAEEKGNIDLAQQELDKATMELTEKMVAQTASKLEYLKGMGDAVADFGYDFGESVFGSLEDRQRALEDMFRSFGEVTKKMILDWVKQRMMYVLNKKLMAKADKDFHKTSVSENKKGMDAQVAIEQAGGEAIAKGTQKVAESVLSASKQKSAESVSDKAKETTAKVNLGIAEGAAETIGKLGWWGIPLVAVITALLNGLLGAALSKVSSLFGGGADKQAAMPKTKIVSGMLTYDSGNVQQVGQYVGSDGKSYTAHSVPRLTTGIVTSPIATSVNGTPALVGERGPEIVIGRETTHALMMSQPDLVRYLVQYDRNHSGMRRTFDSGNLGDLGGMGGSEMEQLLAAIHTMNENNQELQSQLRRGIYARINRHGRGGLVEELADGVIFERGKNNPMIKRAFGG